MESVIEQETEETPAMEDMIVQDDAGEEEETELSGLQETTDQPSENTMEVDENEKSNRKRESKEESEATQAKKACLEKEKEDEHKNENNTDAEDSINLDIGDDELLNEEVCFYFFSVSIKLATDNNKVSNGHSNGYMMEID